MSPHSRCTGSRLKMATAAANPAQTTRAPASQYPGQVAGDRHATPSPRSVITLAMLLGRANSHEAGVRPAGQEICCLQEEKVCRHRHVKGEGDVAHKGDPGQDHPALPAEATPVSAGQPAPL